MAGMPLVRCAPGEGLGVAERTGRAIVDLAAVRANLRTARALAGPREVIAVVKADAYGHGAGAVAAALVAEGCTRLAVLDVHEGCALREAGVSVPVLVLGGAHDAAQASLASDFGLTLTVHDAGGVRLAGEAARAAGRPMPVHVEIDSGMSRMGVLPDAAPGVLADIAADPALVLEGVYSHFARADDPSPESGLEQVRVFRRVLARARERGIEAPLVHVANSAALQADPALASALPEANAVRPGLLLYGARTADHQDPEGRLQPVMSIRTHVVAVRDVAAGTSVGYDGTWRAPRATRIATLPIGYADGVLRALSSRGAVWLAGAVRPIVGRVSMDYVTVDVGDASVAPGEEATFIGRPSSTAARAAEQETGSARSVEGFGDGPGIAVEDQARAAGTLAYELLVRVGERLPRRHVDGETGGPAPV
jgi:alanine racemase